MMVRFGQDGAGLLVENLEYDCQPCHASAERGGAEDGAASPLILAGQFLLKGLMLLADVATMSDLHPARTRTPELATRAPLWNGA